MTDIVAPMPPSKIRLRWDCVRCGAENVCWLADPENPNGLCDRCRAVAAAEYAEHVAGTPVGDASMRMADVLDVAPAPTAPLRTGVAWVDLQLADLFGDSPHCVSCGEPAQVVEIIETHEVGDRDLWATPVCEACLLIPAKT